MKCVDPVDVQIILTNMCLESYINRKSQCLSYPKVTKQDAKQMIRNTLYCVFRGIVINALAWSERTSPHFATSQCSIRIFVTRHKSGSALRSIG